MNVVNLDYLKDRDGYWYLASPYSKYPFGLEAAFIDISRYAGDLIRNDVIVYSPIAHTHPVAMNSGLDPLDHTIWLPLDEPIMRKACGLIICMMDTWQESYGISEEIKMFKNLGRPIVYYNPHTGELTKGV